MGSESLLSCISLFLWHLSNNDLESRAEVIQGHTFWRQSKARVRLYAVFQKKEATKLLAVTLSNLNRF